ncbi:MAG: HEAT repeat domain-containing protein [Acidobacteriota bacterium]|nr:HEAT repeat domain-containing protein [Acidobacteriota bacterium]
MLANVLVVTSVAVYIAMVFGCAHLLQVFDDDALRYAVAFSTVQVAVLFFLIAILVGSKYAREHASRVHILRIARLEDLVAATARDNVCVELEKLATAWPRQFIQVIGKALRSLEGSMRRNLQKAVESSTVFPVLLAEVLDENPARSLAALSLLGRLDNPECQVMVERALSHPAESVRMAARGAILSTGREEACWKVLLELGSMPSWQRTVLFSRVRAQCPLLPDFLSHAFASGDDGVTLAAFELILTLQKLHLVVAPASLARSANTEVRIKFFRALLWFQPDRELLDVLSLGLDDRDWRVRAMAARACGHFRSAPLASRLLEICQSPETPAEGDHAARSLAAMGGEAWLQLKRLALSGTPQSRRIAAGAVAIHMMKRAETIR